MVFSEINDKTHWIEAGRCYERLALREQFATFLGIGDPRPDLVVRIGRGPEMPRSLRRPVEQVLV